jgi:mono/diheme cytochrome c family protein
MMCRLRFRLLGALWLVAGTAASLPYARAQVPADQAALVEKGRYVAIAADCRACHTKPKGGKDFAGGYGIGSPVGTIFSTNITPSRVAGIGSYSEAQFARAVRAGVRADGTHLYPAMPYTSYAGMTDKDLHALYTYFMQGVAPVDEQPPRTSLAFPFNLRFSMIAWNILFLDRKPYLPDGGKSAEWNRGAYLADVLAHCSVCHTPRTLLLAEDVRRSYAGAPLGPWHAPNITSDEVSGIGGWSNQELVQYLKTGHAAGKDQAAAGMGEAVENSLQFLRDDDLQAIVVYLKALPAIRNPSDTKPAYSHGALAAFEPVLRGASGPNEHDSVTSAEALYSGYCASCHQPSGAGSDQQDYPSLFHNAATGSGTAANLVSAILFGVDRTVEKHVLMPRFDNQSYVQPLSDAQIVLISNYVLQQFGNPAVRVTAEDVATARNGGPAPLLALLSPYLLPATVVVALLLVGLVLWHRKRQARAR